MQVNSSSWFIPKIDKKKLKALSKRSDLPGLIHFTIYYSSLFIFGYLSYLLWGSVLFFLFFFIYSTIYAFVVANWHETVHKTAFKTRWINEIFYHISCFQSYSEPTSLRWSHSFHHSNTLKTQDQYDHEIEVSRPTDLFKFFLKFIPLTDFFYIHQSPFVNIIKLSLGFVNPSMKVSTPKKEWLKIIFHARIFFFLWIIIILFSYLINSWWPIIFYFLPTFIGRPIHFAVNVTQHLAAKFDSKDHRLSTHTVILNPILSFYYWHMEYHIEHHMFPMVPSYNLKKLRKEIKDDLPPPFYGLFDFYKKVLPSLIKLAFNLNDYYKVKLPYEKK